MAKDDEISKIKVQCYRCRKTIFHKDSVWVHWVKDCGDITRYCESCYRFIFGANPPDEREVLGWGGHPRRRAGEENNG